VREREETNKNRIIAYSRMRVSERECVCVREGERHSKKEREREMTIEVRQKAFSQSPSTTRRAKSVKRDQTRFGVIHPTVISKDFNNQPPSKSILLC
jgi:hypothetical protein